MTLNGQKNGDPSITTFPAARQLDPLVERRSDCGYSLKKRGKTVELLALAKPLRSQHERRYAASAAASLFSMFSTVCQLFRFKSVS